MGLSDDELCAPPLHPGRPSQDSQQAEGTLAWEWLTSLKGLAKPRPRGALLPLSWVEVTSVWKCSSPKQAVSISNHEEENW